MRMFLAVVGLMLGLASPARAMEGGDCAPVPGAEALWRGVESGSSARPIRWAVIGEIHGSAEMPAAFADLVCLAAARSGRPIVVGLELPPDEQPRLDAYMASDGGPAARAALLAGLFWHPRFPDGRSSMAWLDLIERMRTYKAQGRIAGLVAIRRTLPPDSPQFRDQDANEGAMADAMREAAQGDALSLIYVGNIHAAIRRPNGLPYDPAASRLPAEATLSINMMGNGGAFWNCQQASRDSPDVSCGRHDAGAMGAAMPRGITVLSRPNFPWSGLFALGVPTTASPPAIQGGTAAASGD